MSTLKPKVNCTVTHATRSFDRHGQEELNEKTRRTRCHVIRLQSSFQATSVRTDVSASRGRAEEAVYDVRLLFKPSEAVQPGDVIEVMPNGLPSVKCRVIHATPKTDIDGVTHHIDVEGERWA